MPDSESKAERRIETEPAAAIHIPLFRFADTFFKCAGWVLITSATGYAANKTHSWVLQALSYAESSLLAVLLGTVWFWLMDFTRRRRPKDVWLILVEIACGLAFAAIFVDEGYPPGIFDKIIDALIAAQGK